MTFCPCTFLQDHACGNPNHPSVVVEESRMTVGYHKGMDAEGIPGKKGIYLTGYKLSLEGIYLIGYKLLLYEQKKYLLNWIQIVAGRYLLNWIQITVV